MDDLEGGQMSDLVIRTVSPLETREMRQHRKARRFVRDPHHLGIGGQFSKSLQFSNGIDRLD